MERNPHFVVADSGSSDIGPHPLGADEPASPEEWQRHDLEILLTETRRRGVPLIIGSAADTGTRRGVDLYVRILREVAAAHRLPPFRLAYIYADVEVEEIRRRLLAGVRIPGLDGRPDLTLQDLDRTDRAVAVMGPEPIVRALELGADVVVCGRASDASIFAAPLLWRGISPATAYYAGKVLECASFCAEPFMGKESVLGIVREGEVVLEPMHPGQRCTPASVASHAMYERATPYFERVPGGVLDMRGCVYEALDDRRTRVTGFTFQPSDCYSVKLEGAGKVGERCLAVVGLRDPTTIARIDEVIAWARSKVEARFGREGYQLFYHVYGRNGVMQELEPRPVPGHELAVIVEGVAPTLALAREVTAMGARQMFYARLPDVRGTAGTAALMSDEVLVARPAYEWTLNHALPVDDPLELFQIHLITVEPG
ncbi:MAG: acyclic terpene utilization AtuA family protein [Bacillota bacterium]|nr:MAG: glutamate mutase [Bacillota bacterium]